MSEMIDQGAISIKRSEYWIEVEMNAEVLFDSGSSDLYPSVVPILNDLGKTLANFPNHGTSKDIPIRFLSTLKHSHRTGNFPVVARRQ